MPPQTNTIQDIYKQMELDRLYAGKSSGDENTMLGLFASKVLGKDVPTSLTAGQIPPLSTTGKVTPENLSDMWAFLNPPLGEGVEAPGLGQLEWAAGPAAGKSGALKRILSAYKNLKTTNTPALLKRFNLKVDNPIYHNTHPNLASSILKTGKIEKAKPEFEALRRSVSLTRNPSMVEIPGQGEQSIQIVLDKKNIKSMRGAKVEPYVYTSGKGKDTISGSPPLGKASPWFEAEERVVFSGEGIPASNIKAIKIRDFESTPTHDLSSSINSIIKRAANKKIPVIVEPAAEEKVMGLLDLMNPKQQSKVLKNTKFGGETVTLFRGIKDWHKGKMVKDKNFVGPTGGVGVYEGSSRLFTSGRRSFGENYATSSWGYPLGRGHSSRLLEFEVPLAWAKRHGVTDHWYGKVISGHKGRPQTYTKLSDPFVRKSDIPKMNEISFEKLPTAFLKKVHK